MRVDPWGRTTGGSLISVHAAHWEANWGEMEILHLIKERLHWR